MAQKPAKTDVDQYPTLKDGLTRLLRNTTHGEELVRRIDIRFGANGDAYYRIWVGREEDNGAGFVAAPD